MGPLLARPTTAQSLASLLDFEGISMHPEQHELPDSRTEIPYTQSRQGLSKEGLIGHIANSIVYWGRGVLRKLDLYRGTQNDLQFLLKPAIREYQNFDLDVWELPSTEAGHAALRTGLSRRDGGWEVEHVIPTACVQWALFNEIQNLDSFQDVCRKVREVLERTNVQAVVHRDEHQELKEMDSCMPEEVNAYEHWTGEAVWARYRALKVPIPVIRDRTGRPL